MDQLLDPACQIHSLRLFHNQASHTSHLLTAMATNCSIKTLDIYELDEGSASALSTFLQLTTHCVTTLRLQQLQDLAAVSTLASALACSTCIQELQLASLSDDGLQVLAQGLARRPPSPAPLAHLNLLRCSVGVRSATALTLAASAAPGLHLTALHITESSLQDEALLALLSHGSLQGLSSLTMLDLRNNRLAARGRLWEGRLGIVLGDMRLGVAAG